jgi:hypothetical protein
MNLIPFQTFPSFNRCATFQGVKDNYDSEGNFHVCGIAQMSTSELLISELKPEVGEKPVFVSCNRRFGRSICNNGALSASLFSNPANESSHGGNS